MKLRSIYSDDRTDYGLGLKIPYLAEQLEKNLEEGTAVSFQFVKNKKGWYIQSCVTIERKEALQIEGIIGIDINDGFFAVSGAAKDGSFMPFEDIPFPKDLCSEADASKLKEAVCGIFRKAQELHYGITIEDVNLSSKNLQTYAPPLPLYKISGSLRIAFHKKEHSSMVLVCLLDFRTGIFLYVVIRHHPPSGSRVCDRAPCPGHRPSIRKLIDEKQMLTAASADKLATSPEDGEVSHCLPNLQEESC